MTSKFFWLAFSIISLYSSQVFSKVVLYPASGISLNAYPGASVEGLLKFLPDKQELKPIYYQLSTFKNNNQDIDKAKLSIKTRYTNGFVSLDGLQPIASGKENSNPVTIAIKFKSSWQDVPGTYLGLLSPNINANERINAYGLEPLPKIPVKISIRKKTELKLTPDKINIPTSSFDAPTIREVKINLGTNKPSWSLFLTANNLIQNDGRFISNERVYVRIKNNLHTAEWIAINTPVKILSGNASAPKDVATLEFMVDSDRLDKSGGYFGNFKFLIK